MFLVLLLPNLYSNNSLFVLPFVLLLNLLQMLNLLFLFLIRPTNIIHVNSLSSSYNLSSHAFSQFFSFLFQIIKLFVLFLFLLLIKTNLLWVFTLTRISSFLWQCRWIRFFINFFVFLFPFYFSSILVYEALPSSKWFVPMCLQITCEFH